MDENIGKYIHILKERGLFIFFMKSFKSLDVFKKYVSNINLKTTKIDKNNNLCCFKDLEDFFQNAKPSQMLTCAFNWASSIERYEFWRDINARYRQILGYNPSNWGGLDDDDYKIIKFKKQ